MLHPTDPKKLNNKEDTSYVAWILPRRGNKILIRRKWREGTGWEREYRDYLKVVTIRCVKRQGIGLDDYETEW